MVRDKQKRSQNGGSSASTSKHDHQRLTADTPEWGATIFNKLDDSIRTLDTKVTAFNDQIQTSIETAANAMALVKTQQTTIDTLTSRVDYLTNALEFLLTENRKRDDHVLKNETYSRRDNLVFRGFTTANNDNESCVDKVGTILRAMGIQQPHKIPFIRCHYLNDNKQIIVRFQLYTDRERIWTNRYKLKNTNYYIAEDFPPAVISQRRQLYPVFKAAKSLPEYQKKVTMRDDKLILNGKQYTCQDISSVPAAIHPRKLAERSNDDILVFGGSTSSHHELSNFYNIKKKFVYEHFEYSSSEQALQHKKARLANDQNKQREIMFNPSPFVQKILGRDIQGLSKDEWDHQKHDIMKDILLAKFTQHQDLQKCLLDTGNKKLAEANGRDSFFAIGLPLTHPNVLDPTKWASNGNHLGNILMEIRRELSV